LGVTNPDVYSTKVGTNLEVEAAMAKSIEKTDIYGDKYTVNYDDDGNKVSESRTKTDIYGDSYVQHVDMDGDKIGESRTKTNIYGDSYVQHSDSDSEKIGESWTKTDIYGDRYVQHLDDEGDKVGESRTKTDIYGDHYVKHTGDVPYHQDRQAQAASDYSVSSDGVSCSSKDSYSADYSSAGSTSSYASSSGTFGWLYGLALVAIYFLVPVTMAIVAEHNHNLGPFGPQVSPNGTLLHPGTGFPQWFFFLWPVAIAMTVLFSGLELLFVLFGKATPNLHFLIGVALPCVAFWLVVAIAIPFLSKFIRD
jgi:hypothetical protein